MKRIKNIKTNESYFFEKHSSGLPIYIYPKKGICSSYAVIGTRYGSINTEFMFNDKKISVPDGIAHYLEHKLFECEDGDAFSKFAKTGANANAFTSFDQTCYLFDCTDKFAQSLEILLNFVKSPYFTEESVKKEQGIIGQEIKMYDDDPSWNILFNLLNAMYVNHPVKVDIAGTVDTIAEITPAKLYDCYNSYYNLNNMVLCVSGNVDPKEVFKIADRVLKPENPVTIKSLFPQEPDNINQEYVEKQFPIASTMFELGFKENATDKRKTAFEIACIDIFMFAFASKISPLYNNLLEKQLINSTFSYEYFEGPGYASIIFSGESDNPKQVTEIIKEDIQLLKNNKISKKAFEIAKKAVYGKTISLLDNIKFMGNGTINGHFSGMTIFDYIDAVSNITLEDINTEIDEHLFIDRSALSVITPMHQEEV